MAQSAKPGEVVEKPFWNTLHGKKLWGLHFPVLAGWFLTLGLERKSNTDFQALYLKLEQESNLQRATQN